MMAMEVNQTFFAWSQGETTELDGSQGVSVSHTLDHGSISFGRFEVESLSWERWSVFANDRRHEEFGKFNGLVAEKKAYFEEYYKRIRELKASQQQNQQIELTLEYNGDGSDSSQTEEDMPAAELQSPTGLGVAVYDYVKQPAHETTSEPGLQCYDEHDDEGFSTELSSSNHFSSERILQQTHQDTKEFGDNSCSDDRVDVMPQNARSGHGGLEAAYEAARAPKRIVEKDSRLRYASKIIPKSVKTFSRSPPDTSVNKNFGSVKPNMKLNQKTKEDSVRPSQRQNAAPQKMAGTAGKNKLAAKDALRATGVERPSSAATRRLIRTDGKKSADVSMPRRPSTAERRLVTRERTEKQAGVTTPCRPSTSERRPVRRQSAETHADAATIRRPSTGERRPVARDSVLKMDLRAPSKTRATVVQPKGATTTVGILKKAATPSTKNRELEPKSNIKGLKGPVTLDSHSNGSKRVDLQVAGKQKSSSVNLPPRRKLISSVGEPALQTYARSKNKEGIQATAQSRASVSKKSTPLQTRNVKARTPNPPPPPPPPRRPSGTVNTPKAINSSVGGRKPKVSAQQWH